VFGAGQLCLPTTDDPGLVEGYLEVEHRWTLDVLDLVLDWGADIIRRHGFYESANFYGPAMLDRFLGKMLGAEIAAPDIVFDKPDLATIAKKLPRMSFWKCPSTTFHMDEGPEVVRQSVRDVFKAFG